jgi:hypothetical protein
MKRLLLAIALFLLVFSAKAQDTFKSYYTLEKDGSIELDITNYEFYERFYTVYNLYNDANFAISEGKDYGLFKIDTKEDIDSYLAQLHSEFSKLDKYDLDDFFPFAKEYLPEEMVTSILFDIFLENSRYTKDGDNTHCIDSDPFCTSEIIAFQAPANSVNESVPSIGCLGSKPCPAWFHMRINTPGQFIIHMEGRDPNTSTQRDIDFCLWGPFNNPTTPCTSQLTSDKIIDCCYSSSYSENAYLGYESGQHQHQTGHGSVNYHNPQTGEYYILLITNFSQQSCRISFTKQENSGPGTTDCSILEPFLQASTPCVNGSLVLEANVIEGASYTWTSADGQTHNGRTWTRNNATLSMAGLYSCHVTAGTQSGTESLNVYVLPNVTANFTVSSGAIAGSPIQFTGTETTYPTGHTSEINVREWNFGDGTTSTSVNPTHTYSTPGTYQVSYHVAITGGDNGNCGDTKTMTLQVNNQFNAVVSSDGTSFCEDDAVPNLTATATGGYGNYTYAWTASPACQIDYPNSATTTAHPGVGTTTFTCVISDGHDNLTKTVNVTVNPMPDVTITGPNPPHVNYNMPTTLSVPQMAGATYVWTSEPANLIQSGQNTNQITTKNLTVPTTFYVTVSKNGCSDSNEFTIAVGDALFGNVEIIGLPEICSGETTTLKINPSGGSEQYIYNWQPADKIEGSNSLQTITTKELTSSTTFTCTITDTDNHTYTATAPQIIVNPIPEASAYIEDNGTTYDIYHLLAGNQINLTMNDITGATYSWEPAELISNFIDQNHRTARTISLPENENTKFTATVTTASGCSNEDSITVKVFKALDNSYITTSATEICEDFEVMLTAHPDGGTGNFSYHWTPENLCTDPYSQSTLVYPNRYFHEYSCTITDESIDDKTNNRIEKSINIAIKDKPTVNHDLIGQTQVVPGIDYMPYIYEYNVNVSSLQGYDVDNAEYTWEIYSYYETPNHLDGNNSTWMVFPDEDDKNKAYVSIDEEGNALLKCVITTGCGSTVTEKFIYTQGYDHGVSVDEISYDKMISVFPNPSNGELYIGYNDILLTSPLIIKIYGYNGLLIDQIYGEMSSNVTHYSMDGLANGLYLIQVTGDDFVVTKKFVLNK